MSLLSYFPEQFDQLNQFMVSDTEVVRCLRIDPEMKSMLAKALSKMENDEDFAHAFIVHTDLFNDLPTYFEGLFRLLAEQYRRNSEAFESAGIAFEVPCDEKHPLSSALRFLMHAEALTEALPDQVGSIVFILDPDEITDREGYIYAIAFLAEKTRSDWLKFIVLDERSKPLIQLPPVEGRRLGYQTFYLSPQEIEKRLKQDLADPHGLKPSERRQYKGLLAGFAFARKEYAQAEILQRQWVAEAQSEGQPPETAMALFNLANTLGEKGAYAEATDLYGKACEVCLDNDVDALTPLVYVNLGVNLHRQGHLRQAFESLKVARDFFKARNMRPGEAHVVDSLAQMYADDGLYEKAEEAWRYALFLFDGITSEHFRDLRQVGREGILAKLEQLYKKMGRPDKLRALKEEQRGRIA